MDADAQRAEGVVMVEEEQEEQEEEREAVVIKECRRGGEGLHMVGVDGVCLRRVEGVTSQWMRRS